MASIEVSLSTTPRRKKSNSAATTPIPQVFPPNSFSGHTTPTNTIKESTKDVESLRNPLRDKENVIQSLKCHVWSTGPRSNKHSSINEKEKKAAQEKLIRLKAELDAKRLVIKNIKISLEGIDISDNIDVRIKQAELEYQLGREELNLLSIMEEIRNLQVYLEENNEEKHTIFHYVGNSSVSLYAFELVYDAKSPQFGAGYREEGGLYIDWVSDKCALCKGDRLLEVNGKIVIGKTKEDMMRLLEVSPNPAQLVVMRKHAQKPEQIMSHLRAELSVVKEKAGEAERIRDSFRSDNVRLTHRISYLEEQVAELLQRAREVKPKSVEPVKDKTGVQVFQKGHQVALVANLPGLGDCKSEDELLKKSKHQDEVRSVKSVDVHIEKPKRKKDLQPARSTHSLDVDSGQSRKIRHYHAADCKEHKSDVETERVTKRLTEHLHGEQRQKHLRDARSTLLNFFDKRNSGYLDLNSEPEFSRNDCQSQKSLDCNSDASLRHYKKHEKPRPVPPKKPIRLSLQKAMSLQSVESNDKKTLKRTHKGEAPPIPQVNGHKPERNGHITRNESSERWC